MCQEIGQHALGVFKNIEIRIAHHLIALSRQPSITNRILLIVEVLAAVSLNDDLEPQTDEIGDVRTDGRLAAEFRAIQSSVAEQEPELAFGVGHFAPH